MSTKKIVLALTVLTLGIAGCDTCEKAAQTISDLQRGKTLLAQGLSSPHLWKSTCDMLVQSSDVLRSDADFVRSVADSRYGEIPAGCAERSYIEYCSGGWMRRPYYPLTADASEFAQTATDADDLAMEDADGEFDAETFLNDRPGRDHRPHPGPRPAPGPRPMPRPHPAPRPMPRPLPAPRPRPPVVRYPRHYPQHPHWRWGYEPRYCRLVPICVRWEPSQPARPGYEHMLAIAYELDQAAGGIETACRKAYDNGPVDEINTVANETLTRLEKNAIPGASQVYESLGCNAPRSGD